MATNNSWNNQIAGANSAITLNSGTNAVSISTDAAATTVNIATGGAAKTVSVGSTNTTSSLALKYGTSDFTLASATGNVISAIDTGEITYPLQPAFYAYLSSTVTNVTGDGTVYTIAWNTESFDQNGDFASNTFTAPVTGKYFFVLQVGLSDVGAAHTAMQIDFYINGTTARVGTFCNPGAVRVASGGGLYISSTLFINLNASDTVVTRITVAGGTLVVDVVGALTGSYFAGHLVC